MHSDLDGLQRVVRWIRRDVLFESLPKEIETAFPNAQEARAGGQSAG